MLETYINFTAVIVLSFLRNFSISINYICLLAFIVFTTLYICYTVSDNNPLSSGSFEAVFTHAKEITQQVLAVKKVNLGAVKSSLY